VLAAATLWLWVTAGPALKLASPLLYVAVTVYKPIAVKGAWHDADVVIGAVVVVATEAEQRGVLTPARR
jgi:hypothetical protein